jgi:hypothetical protein
MYWNVSGATLAKAAHNEKRLVSPPAFHFSYGQANR